MHLYERPRGQYRGLLSAALVFALLAAVFLIALVSTQQRSAERETEMVISTMISRS
ncbi:MAG: hypothetical protein R2881_06565 [Eubacteriales bacterium]